MIWEVVFGISIFLFFFYLLAFFFGEKGGKEGEKEEPFRAGISLPREAQEYSSRVGYHVFLFLLFDTLIFVLIFSTGRAPIFYLLTLILVAGVVLKSVR